MRHLDFFIVMKNQPSFAVGVRKLWSSVAMLKSCFVGGLSCIK